MEKEPRASRLRVRYLILIDLLCIEASLLASFALRFETITGIWTHLRPCWPLLLIIPAIRIPTYLKSRLSMRVWQ